MQQYRVEFFKNHFSTNPSERRMIYVHHDFANDLVIDDDYMAIEATTIEIGSTTKVEPGNMIRILRDDSDYFFGIVSDVSYGEYSTQVSFKPFVAIFDENIMFNTRYQYSSDNVQGSMSLEETLYTYINELHISNEDHLQCYPISVTIPEARYRTKEWHMNIRSDTEGANHAVVGFYSVLIVRALKDYGLAMRFTPNFENGTIAINISKPSGEMHIDADLPNITVKTLRANDRPNGINKLVVYNTDDYSQTHEFYILTDRTWTIREGQMPITGRIVPVVCEVRSATPEGLYQNPATDFKYAAIAVAFDELSGLAWDNLIELECASNDPLIKPASMRIGQQIAVHFKGDTYTSILTGKNISFETITLVFGSERIKYTKKRVSK